MNDPAKWPRVESAIKELRAAMGEFTGSAVAGALLVTVQENKKVVASYLGCDCPMCRMRIMQAAAREMGGRMHGVRLPDDPETIERIVDAAGRVH